MQELQPTGFESDHIAFFPILLLLLELKSKKFWFVLVFFYFSQVLHITMNSIL